MDRPLEQTDPDFDDELIADAHGSEGDGACGCESCERVRGRDRAEADRHYARALGGISPLGHELLGRGWFDDEPTKKWGGTMQPYRLDELATRCLGDTFGQLARIGEVGRDRAMPRYSVTAIDAAMSGKPGPERETPPLTRSEARELIRAAESALSYARVHVEWLPPDPPASSAGGET